MAELLAHSMQALPQVVGLQHGRIPFIMEQPQQAWYASGLRGPGFYGFVGLQRHEILRGQALLCDWTFACLLDVLVDQAFLEQVPAFLGHNWFLRNRA